MTEQIILRLMNSARWDTVVHMYWPFGNEVVSIITGVCWLYCQFW